MPSDAEEPVAEQLDLLKGILISYRTIKNPLEFGCLSQHFYTEWLNIFFPLRLVWVRSGLKIRTSNYQHREFGCIHMGGILRRNPNQPVTSTPPLPPLPPRPCSTPWILPCPTNHDERAVLLAMWMLLFSCCFKLRREPRRIFSQCQHFKPLRQLTTFFTERKKGSPVGAVPHTSAFSPFLQQEADIGSKLPRSLLVTVRKRDWANRYCQVPIDSCSATSSQWVQVLIEECVQECVLQSVEQNYRI